jgi:hypothetical protein
MAVKWLKFIFNSVNNFFLALLEQDSKEKYPLINLKVTRQGEKGIACI